MIVAVLNPPFKVSVTLYVPLFAYACVASMPEPVLLSPKFHVAVSHAGSIVHRYGKIRKVTVSPALH